MPKNLKMYIMEFFCFMNLFLYVLSTNTKHCPETTKVQFERNIEFIGKVSTPKDKPNQEQKEMSKVTIFYNVLLSTGA